MKTVRSVSQDHLVEHLLWPEQATQVLAIVAEANADVRFDAAADSYPPMAIAVLRLMSRRAALAWLKENHEEHVAIKAIEQSFSGNRG